VLKAGFFSGIQAVSGSIPLSANEGIKGLRPLAVSPFLSGAKGQQPGHPVTLRFSAPIHPSSLPYNDLPKQTNQISGLLTS
jgi:hypothetical protein